MWNEIRPLHILSIGMVTLIIIVIVVITVNIIIMIFIASTIFISQRITIGGTQHCLALGVLFEKCLELGECMSLIQNNVFLPPRFDTILLDSSISIQAH